MPAASSIWDALRMPWFTLSGLAPLLDLLCPPRCACCGVDLPAAADTVCESCRREVTADVRRCAACGEPSGPQPCRCRPGHHWDGIAVLSGYGEPVRGYILKAKRPGGELLAGALAALLVDKHRQTLDAWNVDVVVPVPMHWRRRLMRGATAAGQLAAGVARGLGLPHRRLIRRVRSTPMQNELPFERRSANVRGAFSASPRAAGRRVLLVDDVTTSGATLAACRGALVEAGAAAVYAAVVARADRGVRDDV